MTFWPFGNVGSFVLSFWWCTVSLFSFFPCLGAQQVLHMSFIHIRDHISYWDVTIIQMVSELSQYSVKALKNLSQEQCFSSRCPYCDVAWYLTDLWSSKRLIDCMSWCLFDGWQIGTVEKVQNYETCNIDQLKRWGGLIWCLLY